MKKKCICFLMVLVVMLCTSALAFAEDDFPYPRMMGYTNYSVKIIK